MRRATTEYEQSRPREARQLLLRVRELLSGRTASSSLSSALLLLARVELDLGSLGDASVYVAEAVSLARQNDEAIAECDSLNLQAGILSSLGEHAKALVALERSLELARDLGEPNKEATVLSNLGNLRRQLGDYAGALDSLMAAYELLRVESPGSRNEAVNLINLGQFYNETGDVQSAREFFSLARAVGANAEDGMVEAASLNCLANIASRSEEWCEAEELYLEALELVRRMGLRQYEIDNLDGLGQVYAASGRHREAGVVHLDALRIARDTGDSEGEIETLLNLGRDYLALAAAETALEYLREGLGLAQEQGRKKFLFEAHQQLSLAYERAGMVSEALRHHREFYRTEKEVFNEESEERVKRLQVQFDVERARHEAETYRMRTEVEQQAREQAEAMVLERTHELQEAQQEIVARLAIAGEYRDDGTGEHTRRVGRNAAAIARLLGWRDDEADLLNSAARLHDVGKIGIRDSVLLKPGKLSDEEFELMRDHTSIGGRILSGGRSKLLRLAEEIAFAHHERWDGHGYPCRLAGEEIPQSARIVAVADVLDALTHVRPYKGAWPVAEALAEIRRNSGTQFDPEVVEACMRVFGEEGELCPTEDVPATTVPSGEDSCSRLEPNGGSSLQRFGMPAVEDSGRFWRSRSRE